MKHKLYIYKTTIDPLTVYDGDTILKAKIDLGFGVWVVKDLRLAGIDTPEIRTRDKEEKARGYIARDYLRAIVDGNEGLTLHVQGKGKYGRWLVTLYSGMNNVNKYLVAQNYAREYE